ncbi:MAG: glycosyltransferase [Nitrospirae bacterium]|nr:glycosyltransferase [Nitrospirota bacterium]
MPPLLSIITVVRNDIERLRRTLESIRSCRGNQTEFIVIDGASTDGTLECVRRASQAVDVCISEPDGGIYEAMNKGLALARGDYVLFLNAGDELLMNPEELLAGAEDQSVIVYGRANMLNPDGSLSYIKGKRLKGLRRFLKGMPLCHQSVLYRRAAMPPYDLRYRIMADRVLTYHMLKRHGLARSRFVDRIFVNYYEGGFSGSVSRDVWRSEENMFYRDVGKRHYIAIKQINAIFKYRIKRPILRFLGNMLKEHDRNSGRRT